jgi:hypothetical protein
MLKPLAVLSLLVCVGLVGNLSAQDTAQKTRDLVAALDKTKYKKKEKKNVSIEVYVDIKNEVATRVDPSEYSGRYETDGYQLSLTVAKDGTVSGSGSDTLMNGGESAAFELKDAHVSRALLTGTKVYENSAREPFEAVFVNRTSKTGSNPNSISDSSTKFGIGFIQAGTGTDKDSGWRNRVFLERK